MNVGVLHHINFDNYFFYYFYFYTNFIINKLQMTLNNKVWCGGILAISSNYYLLILCHLNTADVHSPIVSSA